MAILLRQQGTENALIEEYVSLSMNLYESSDAFLRANRVNDMVFTKL